MKIATAKNLKRSKQAKQRLSKALKCLFVFTFLVQPFLTGVTAFAEINRVSGRTVDLTVPTAITDFTFPERVALSSYDIELLLELEEQFFVDLTAAQRSALRRLITDGYTYAINELPTDDRLELLAILAIFFDLDDLFGSDLPTPDVDSSTDLDVDDDFAVNDDKDDEDLDDENADLAVADDEDKILSDLRASLPLRLPTIHDNQVEVDGELYDVNEFSRTYYLGAGYFQTFLTTEPQTFINQNSLLRSGNVETEIDNTLVRRQRGNRRYARNRANRFDVILPEAVTNDTGIELIGANHALELIPLFGKFDLMTTDENAALYNHVLAGIDVQYTVINRGLVQEIIINDFTTETATEFAFQLNGEAGQTFARTLDGVFNMHQNGDVINSITRPIIVDGAGNVSDDGVDWKINDDVITLVVDEDFLASPQTVYPLSLVIALSSYEPTAAQATMSVLTVRESNGGTMQNSAHAGFDDAVASGNSGWVWRWGQVCPITNAHPQHVWWGPGAWCAYDGTGYIETQVQLYESQPWNRTRTFVDVTSSAGFNEMLASFGYDRILEEATFGIMQATRWGDESRINATDFVLLSTDFSWNRNTVTWANQIGGQMTTVGGPQPTGAINSWLRWDITETVNDWAMGISPHPGLVLRANIEGTSTQMQRFCATTAGVCQAPYLSLKWRNASPGVPLADSYVNVHPVIERNLSAGTQRVRGVFASGMTALDAAVEYQLVGTTGSYATTQTTTTSERPSFPNTTYFGDALNADSHPIIRNTANWQTNRFFREFTVNTIYYFSAIATLDDEQSPTVTSDTFLIYQAQMMDTLPRIAAHYGVELGTLMIDNRVQDGLIFPGDTLFIRNPQTAEPFNHPPLVERDKMLIDGANNARGNDSIFGFDPINLLNGNFFMEVADVQLMDVGRDFQIYRTYNVFSYGRNGMFGRGWDFDFNRFVTRDIGGSMLYFRGDGSLLEFKRCHTTNTFTTPRGHDYTLRQVRIGYNEFDDPVYHFEIEDHDGTIYRFNGWGLLDTITTRDGFTTTIDYDDDFNITHIVSPTDLRFDFITNERGFITQIYLPNGRYLLYKYDEYDRLVTMCDADGGCVTYVYDEYHRMIAWYDANGTRIITNYFDEYHRAIKQRDANGHVGTLYFGDGYTRVTDNNGNVTIYQIDQYDRLLQIIHPDGTVTPQGYDDRGFHQISTDYNNNAVNRTFDARGNLLTETRIDGRTRTFAYNDRNQITSQTDFYGRTTTFNFNTDGRLVETVFPDGTRTTQTHDAWGNVITRTDAMGFTTTYTFAGILMTARTDALGNTTRFYHNEMNQLIRTVDPLGRETLQTFNARGDLLMRTYPDGGTVTYERRADGTVTSFTDANGNVTTFAFDDMHQLIGAVNEFGNGVDRILDGNGNIIQEIDEAGNKTRFYFDDLNRQILEIDPDGGRTYHHFNQAGNLYRIVTPQGATTFEHDEKGRVIRETDDFGTIRTIFNLDDGTVYQVITPTGTTTTIYDKMGRLTRRTNELGITTVYEHNLNGDITSRNVNGRITRYIRDQLGRVTRTYNPYNYFTTTTFDAVGNITHTTNELGHTTTHRFDAMNREIETIFADHTRTSRTFDFNGNLTSETDARNHTTTHTYNALNLRTSTTDPYGNTIRFVYDAREQLARQYDARGNATRFYRDGRGNVVRTIDPTGNSWRTEFDVCGNVVREIDPDHNVTRFIYNDQNLRIQAIDADGYITRSYFDEQGRNYRTVTPSGAETRTHFDAHGRAYRQIDIFGNVTETVFDQWGNAIQTITPTGTTDNEFDQLNRLIKTTNEIGITTTFTFDAAGNTVYEYENGRRTTENTFDNRGRLISTTNYYGDTQTFTFDANGNQITRTDANGNTTTTTFDRLNRQTRVTDPYGNDTTSTFDADGNLIAETDQNGNTTRHRYNRRGLRIATQDARQHVTRFAYSGAGRLISETDPYGNTTRFYHDGRGNVTRIIDALGNAWHQEFNATGEITREINPRGHVTTHEFNIQGQRTRTINPNGLITTYYYNDQGLLIRETDNTGRTTTIEYDQHHREIRRTDALGRQATTTYDHRGRVYRTTAFTGQTTINEFDHLNRIIATTDDRNRTTVFTLDPLGNIVVETDAENYRITRTLDRLGRETSTTNQLGYTTYNEFDAVGNLIKLTNANDYSTLFYFDELNQLIQMTDARGNTTEHILDALGREITTILPNGATIETRFDANGNVIIETNANGHATTHEYNELNQRIKTITPRDGEIHFAWDVSGNLTQITDPLGNTTTFTYDLHGNRIGETMPNGATIAREFDLAGRQISETTPLGLVIINEFNYRNHLIRETIQYNGVMAVTQFIYNEYHDLILEIAPNGGQTRHAYDARGHRTSTTDALGNTTDFEFNVLGQAISVTDAYQNTTYFEFDGVGQVIREIRPGNRVHRFIYDEVGNLTQIIDAMGYSERQIFDEMGNVTTIVNRMGHVQQFEHDAMGNVIREIDNLGNDSWFTFDADGNRARSYDRRGNMTRFFFDLAGNMTAITDPGDRTTIFTHDEVGNTISMTDPDGRTVRYEFDGQNNRIGIIHPDGTAERATYNAFGNRASFTHPSGRRSVYHFDEMQNLVLVTYYNANGSAINDVRITRAFDELGNVVVMTDASGTTYFEWDALGRLLSNTRTTLDGETRRVEYVYDEVGNIAQIIYPDGRYSTHEFDRNNREIRTTDVSGNTTYFEYNALGQEIRAINANGIITETTHDEEGHIASVIHTNAAGEIIASFEYERDELGRIERIVAFEDDVEIITTFTYLPTGELASFTERVGGILGERTHHRFTYDNSGNRIRQVISGERNEEILYFYNDLNQLIMTDSTIDGRTDFTFDLDGNMTARRNGNIVRTYYHDVENRLTMVRENSILLTGSQFDGDGNRVAAIEGVAYLFNFTLEDTTTEAVQKTDLITQKLWQLGIQAETPGWRDSYGVRPYFPPEMVREITDTYDIFEEVEVWAVSPFWEIFGMAFVGWMSMAFFGLGMLSNMRRYRRWFNDNFVSTELVVRDTETTVVMQYSSSDIEFLRIMGLTEDDFARIGQPSERQPIWVTRNQQRSETIETPTDEHGVALRYFVEISHFVNCINRENTQVLATYGTRNELRNVYTRRGDRLISDEHTFGSSDPIVSTMLSDGRTSIVALTDASGVVTTRYRYDSFGNMTKGRPIQGMIYGFNAEKFHSDGYLFLRARFYDKSIGRFLTRDTFLGWEDVPLSLNRYSYVHNDPINYIDPTGLSALSIAQLFQRAHMHPPGSPAYNMYMNKARAAEQAAAQRQQQQRQQNNQALQSTNHGSYSSRDIVAAAQAAAGMAAGSQAQQQAMANVNHMSTAATNSILASQGAGPGTAMWNTTTGGFTKTQPTFVRQPQPTAAEMSAKIIAAHTRNVCAPNEPIDIYGHQFIMTRKMYDAFTKNGHKIFPGSQELNALILMITQHPNLNRDTADRIITEIMENLNIRPDLRGAIAIGVDYWLRHHSRPLPPANAKSVDDPQATQHISNVLSSISKNASLWLITDAPADFLNHITGGAGFMGGIGKAYSVLGWFLVVYNTVYNIENRIEADGNDPRFGAIIAEEVTRSGFSVAGAIIGFKVAGPPGLIVGGVVGEGIFDALQPRRDPNLGVENPELWFIPN